MYINLHGVSAPLARPGVASHRLFEGVASASSQLDFFFAGVSSAVWSQRLGRFLGTAALASPLLVGAPFAGFSVPSLAFSLNCSS